MLLVINVTAGFIWSPLTSLRFVRVEGALEADRVRIEEAVQLSRGVPWVRFNQEQLASLILLNPGLENLTIETNPFGRGLVKVSYKSAVAVVGDGLLLSDRGDLFPGRAAVDLPRVNVPDEALKLNGTIVSGWDSGKIASLCESLRGKVPNLGWIVDVDERSVLSLQIGDRTKVVLGTTQNIDKKLEKLVEIIDKRPELFRAPAEINLVVPDEPSIRVVPNS
jgi:hypothetical protein